MRRQALIIPGLCAISLSALAVYILFIAKTPARAALPGSAQDIHDYISPSFGMTGDYMYALKARITKDEFDRFVQDLHLTPLLINKDYRGWEHNWSLMNDKRNQWASWWDPSDSVANAYYDNTAKGSLIILAKYENGCVYYKESCGF
jgi:hypothetical protein